MECDPLIEEIVKLVREKWPETVSIDIERGCVSWCNGKLTEQECSIMAWHVPKGRKRLNEACYEIAPDLPALRDKLKEMKEAEDGR